MDRRGVSFTLTLVITGAILLMTALSLITLSGSSLTQWFNTVTEQTTAAVVEKECGELKQQINRQYCDQYVNPDAPAPCSETRERRTPDYSATASSQACPLSSWSGWPSQLTVTVEGNEYSCIEEGHISRDARCPA